MSASEYEFPGRKAARVTHGTLAASLRKLTLEHADGGVTVTSIVPDFVLLEAFLRAHLEPAKVHDATE